MIRGPLLDGPVADRSKAYFLQHIGVDADRIEVVVHIAVVHIAVVHIAVGRIAVVHTVAVHRVDRRVVVVAVVLEVDKVAEVDYCNNKVVDFEQDFQKVDLTVVCFRRSSFSHCRGV